MVESIPVDWTDQIFTVQINFSCPFCNGDGTISFQDWLKHEGTWGLGKSRTEDEKRKTGKYACYRRYVTETNRQHYVKEFNKLKNSAKQGMTEEDYLKRVYEEDNLCEECSGEGFIEPMMNYAYPVCCEFNDENRKKAMNRGLFLFEHPTDGQVYMSLMGGGMNLSQSIALAYLDIEGFVPYHLVHDVCVSNPLSISRKDFLVLLKQLKERLTCSVYADRERLKKVTEKIIESNSAQAKLIKT